MHNKADDLQTILQYQLIPWWEHYGIKRLTISAPTLREFKAQPLPSAMSISVKRRRSRKVSVRGPRAYNNVSMSVEAFPADAQDTCRHPILYCVLKGQADLHIADYVAHCPAGHFVLMRPGVPQPDGSRAHLEEENSEEYCEILHLSLLPGASCIAAWICYSEPGRHWAQHGCLIYQQDLVHQFRLFIKESLNAPPDYQKTVSNSFHNFLLLFYRELKEGRLQPRMDGNHPPYSSGDENPMTLAQEYLRSHLHQQLTCAKVAEAVFMSRSNFQRRFTKATGQSFNQYLTSLRLERARELLADTNMSVQAVSERVGIKPAQLYRIFKNHLGVSPSEFQQNRKMEQND